MSLGQRTILWIGEPCFLARVSGGLFSRRVLSVEEGPAYLGGDPGELSAWLAARVHPGTTLDLVYQHHLLLVESFPGITVGDLDGELRIRLKRDLLFSADGLVSV